MNAWIGWIGLGFTVLIGALFIVQLGLRIASELMFSKTPVHYEDQKPKAQGLINGRPLRYENGRPQVLDKRGKWRDY